MLTNHYTFKDNKDSMGLSQLLLPLQAILSQMVFYAAIHHLPWKYTRIIGERIPNVSVSDTHGQGRAADVSTRFWTDNEIEAFEDYFNSLYGEKYGTSMDGKDNKIVVYHKGTGYHFHIQIRRNIILSDFLADFYKNI